MRNIFASYQSTAILYNGSVATDTPLLRGLARGNFRLRIIQNFTIHENISIFNRYYKIWVVVVQTLLISDHGYKKLYTLLYLEIWRPGAHTKFLSIWWRGEVYLFLVKSLLLFWM